MIEEVPWLQSETPPTTKESQDQAKKIINRVYQNSTQTPTFVRAPLRGLCDFSMLRFPASQDAHFASPP